LRSTSRSRTPTSPRPTESRRVRRSAASDSAGVRRTRAPSPEMQVEPSEEKLLAQELLEALGQVQTRRVEVLGTGAKSSARRQGLGRVGLLLCGLQLGSRLGRVAGARLLFGALLTLAGTVEAAGASNARHAGNAAALSHLLHHLLGLAEALQQAVNLGDVHTGTLGDAGAA